MEALAEQLTQRGYAVANIDYPSREHPIETLAPLAIELGLKTCQTQQAHTVHFISHSLGGILIRYYLSTEAIPNLGRTVMLGPPNHGSEAVDRLKNMPGFKLLNGPAGQQLGTDSHSIPNQLGPVQFEVGIIAGHRSINLMLSSMIPSTDDGKVSIESARLDSARDFLTLPVSHPFLMQNQEVMLQAIHFIQHGEFNHSNPNN